MKTYPILDLKEQNLKYQEKSYSFHISSPYSMVIHTSYHPIKVMQTKMDPTKAQKYAQPPSPPPSRIGFIQPVTS